MIDLDHIARYHENDRIEAKKAAGGFPHSLWETYSAFANTIGGLILLGVEEDRAKGLHVTGIPDPDGYRATFWQTVRDPAKVSACVVTEDDVTVQRVQGKDVLVISVPRAGRRDRPVYIGDSPFSGSYRRGGEGDYHCSPDEVRAMLRDREDAPADLAVLAGRSPEDLSPETLRQFRTLMAMRRPDHPWTQLPDPAFLTEAGILGHGRDGVHPTIAGLLLLGRQSALREVFPQLRLTYHEEGGACLTTRGPGRPENLFDFYGMTASRLTAAAALLEPDRSARDALAAALREALLNAILHADYFGNGTLDVHWTPSGLAVSNGGLLRPSPDEARSGGRPDPRNVALARLFSLVRLGSGAGRGLKGIYALWAQQGWRAPVLSEAFRAGVTSLSLPLPRPSFTPDELTRQEVAEGLTDAVAAAPDDLAAALGLPPADVRRALDGLLADGLVTCTDGSYRLRA